MQLINQEQAGVRHCGTGSANSNSASVGFFVGIFLKGLHESDRTPNLYVELVRIAARKLQKIQNS